MSLQATCATWALKLEPDLKLVLLALADYANTQGIAWPKTATLAAKCDVPVRTVERRLATLRERGLIASVQRGGRGRGTTYAVLPHVLPPAQSPPARGGDSEGESPPHSGGDSPAQSPPARGGDSAQAESPPATAGFLSRAESESPPVSVESPPQLRRGPLEPGTVRVPPATDLSSSNSNQPAAADSVTEQPQHQRALEEEVGRAAAIAEMEAYAAERTRRIREADPGRGPSAAQRFQAAAEMVIVEGVEAWRNPHTGQHVPWPDRPKLFRTAVLQHLASPAFNLGSSLRYTLKSELDPSHIDPASEAAGASIRESRARGRPRTADGSIDPVSREVAASLRMPVESATDLGFEQIDRWASEHPDVATEVRSSVYGDAKLDELQPWDRVLKETEFRNRIRQRMAGVAA